MFWKSFVFAATVVSAFFSVSESALAQFNESGYMPFHTCNSNACIQMMNDNMDIAFTPDGVAMGWKKKTVPADPGNGDGTTPEKRAPSCGANASLRGGSGSTEFSCVCHNGGSYPNCKPSGAAENPDSRYEGCKAQALQAISDCQSGYGGATTSCATTRVDGVVQQAHAANEQQLNKSENNAQACGGTSQAYRDAANQLGSVQSSCQSSVNQCASSCAQAQRAAQQCPHSAVRARAGVAATAQQNCTSGELAQRPQQIAQTSTSLQDVGARDAGNCNQNTSASAASNPSSGGTAGEASNTSGGGTLKQEAGDLTPGSGLGNGGDVAGGSTLPTGVNPATGNRSNPDSLSGGFGGDEAYNVSGKNRAAVSGGGGLVMDSSALAALPGTPVQTKNSEDTDVQSGKGTGGEASSGGGSAGSRGGGGRFMFLPRKAGVGGAEVTEAVRAAGQAPEETPDLSAFLPGGRGIAGGTVAGLNGCRIPDPANPRQCAVPHGPTMNIWSKMKERFELLRNAPPPSDYFFNEE